MGSEETGRRESPTVCAMSVALSQRAKRRWTWPFSAYCWHRQAVVGRGSEPGDRRPGRGGGLARPAVRRRAGSPARELRVRNAGGGAGRAAGLTNSAPSSRERATTGVPERVVQASRVERAVIRLEKEVRGGLQPINRVDRILLGPASAEEPAARLPGPDASLQCSDSRCVKRFAIPDRTMPRIPSKADRLRLVFFGTEGGTVGVDIALQD